MDDDEIKYLKDNFINAVIAAKLICVLKDIQQTPNDDAAELIEVLGAYLERVQRAFR